MKIDKKKLEGVALEFANAAKKEIERKLIWFEKFHKLTKEQRKAIVEKIYDKYTSTSYLNREYNRGYEPRYELYYLLFDYATIYGEPFEYMQNRNFPEEQYLIDDSILVSKVYGQGDFVYIKFLDEDHGKRWLRGDFHDALQKFLQKWAGKIRGQYTIQGTFKLESHQHKHKDNTEKFTIDSFEFDISEPNISKD